MYDNYRQWHNFFTQFLLCPLFSIQVRSETVSDVLRAVRPATMYSLIVTARLNDVDPQTWLADVLARINDIPNPRLHELLP